MGSMLSFRGKRYLIDAGPGIDYSLERLGIDIAELNGLFITHAHDDHFAGLTSLLRGDTKIDVFATRPVMATVRYKLSALLGRPPDFMDHLVNIHYLTEDIWNKIEGIEVRPTMSPHPLETTIMFFRALWEGGYKTYAHLADIVSDEVLKRFVKPDGVTSEFRNRVWSEYLRPADVKKIDAGRGLIHGFAEDFADDRSPCLILSHYEGELSDSEKEIGASVAFGQTDILIPARGDRLRDAAEELLSRTLPGLPSEDFDLLLNGTVESIPPDTALLRKGSIPESLLLIITGTVDALESGDNPHLRFTAGSLIGEGEFLNRKPASAAYRSRNHVKAMRIPADLYVHALKKAGWINSRLDILSRRDFLHRGAFPGQVVSCPRLDEIAGSMKEVNWRRGKTTASGVEELYILMSGSVLESESGLEKELQPGALMNIGGVVLFSEKTVNPSWKALTASKVAVIPAAVIRETPVLAWTLAESAAAD
jgi:hemerythrin